MHKNKLVILSTAQLEDGLIQEADAAGISIDVVPFIEVQPIVNDALEKEKEEIGKESVVVVITSGNTPLPETGGEHWKIYCVGNATKKVIEKRFGVEAIAGNADNADALANLIIENTSIKEVVYFCGDIRRDELPNKLKQHNIAVREIVVYRTIGLPQRVEKTYDGIMFFSPSGVSGFTVMNEMPAKAVLFAIGDTTANAIRTIASNEVIVAAKPGKKALIETMIGYYEQVLK